MNQTIYSDESMIARVATRSRQIAPGITAIENIFPEGFLAIQTSREGGVSQTPFGSFNLASHVGDVPAAVHANRQRLEKCCATFPVWLNQVHGTQVADLDALQPPFGLGPAPEADAAIASEIGRACTILTADCLPILVARQRAPGCAAVHAGWRGLCAGVIEKTLSAMLARDPAPDCWSFWLGPCIGPSAFEVGEDVRQAFMLQSPVSGLAFTARADADGKYLADLRLLAEQRIAQWFALHPQALLTAGSESGADFPPIRIARSNDCTVLDPERYFSFRRDRETGRMASLIGRLPI